LLFAKFFEVISSMLPNYRFIGNPEDLARLNPQKIYLESVRSILGVSTGTAARICETAVRQGLFRKSIEVVCPDGAVAASAESEADLPQQVRCWNQEDGVFEEIMIPTSELAKTVFYRLNDETATARPHAHSA
jgi:hypothetical protein